MHFVKLTPAIIAIGALAACSIGGGRSDEDVQRSFPVAAFDRVDAAGAYDIEIATGGGPSFQARGSQEILDQLDVTVDDGTLRIRPRESRFNWFDREQRGGVHLRITAPALQSASLAGAGKMHIDRVSGDRFEGTVAGAGDLVIGSSEVRELKLSLAGAGSTRVDGGSAERLTIDIAGAGESDMRKLAARHARLTLAGAGSVRAQASGTAVVEILGAGDVEITGGAKCTVERKGPGSVRCS